MYGEEVFRDFDDLFEAFVKKLAISVLGELG